MVDFIKKRDYLSLASCLKLFANFNTKYSLDMYTMLLLALTLPQIVSLTCLLAVLWDFTVLLEVLVSFTPCKHIFCRSISPLLSQLNVRISFLFKVTNPIANTFLSLLSDFIDSFIFLSIFETF